jgi:hypothetical protein
MNDLSEYYKIRNTIKTGDHLGWKSDCIVGHIINIFAPGPINHSELVIRLNFEGLEKRRFSGGAAIGGVSLHMLSRQLEKYNGEVYWYPLKDEYNEIRPKIASFILQKVDIRFDYYNLFKNALGRVSTEDSRFFCSEVVNWAYVNAGIDTGFPLNGKAPTPADIDQFAIFKEKVRIL